MADIPKLNEFAGPPELDPEPILEIHRGSSDGYVGFMAKEEGGDRAKNIAAVKVKDVRELLPGILAHYVKYDGYFTVNSYGYAGGVWKKTGFNWLLREEKYLLELAACYADLDVGRPGVISFEAAQIKALQLQQAGIIPPFSIMACSGRGMYLFWLLKDDKNPEALPRAREAIIIRYKRINQALHKLLYELEPDTKAHDAARVLRIPGSIHRKTFKKVSYSLTVQADSGGRLTYTLPELEEFLNIQAPDLSLPEDVREKAQTQIYTREPYRKTKNKGSAPGRRKGYYRINELRAKDLETIETWRGGFLHAGHKYPDGFTAPGRRFMLSLYAQWLQGAGQKKRAVSKAVKIMAGNCRPAYPSDPSDPPLKEIINDAFNKTPQKHFKNFSNKRLCLLLGINEYTDPELLQQLDSILPPAIKELRSAELPKQADFTQARRDLIIKHMQDALKVPALRKMSRILSDYGIVNPATGKPWSYEIIREDYAVIKPWDIIQESLKKNIKP